METQVDNEIHLNEEIIQICNEKDIKILLNILKLKEPEAFIHSLRVANQMSNTFGATGDILRGCILHDVGKAFTPFSLTLYPNQLTPDERKLVSIHTLVGTELLGDYSEEIRNCVRYHHDSTCQKLYVKQLMICDIYDALTNDRPYKQALNTQEALKILERTSVDSEVLKEFENHLTNSITKKRKEVYV